MKLKKFCIQVLVVFTILFAIPFNIFAYEVSNHIIGFNYKITAMTSSTVASQSTSSCDIGASNITFQTNNNVTMSYNGYSYNNYPIYSSNVPIKGTASMGSSTQTCKYSNGSYVSFNKIIVEYEVVLDNSYVGDISLRFYNDKDHINVSETKYVNGSSLKGSIVYYQGFFNPLNVELVSFHLSPSEKFSFSFPIESISYVNYFSKFYDAKQLFSNFNWSYPSFDIKKDFDIMNTSASCIIFGINQNIYNFDALKRFFTFNDVDSDIELVKIIDSGTFSTIRLNFLKGQVHHVTALSDLSIVPIFVGSRVTSNLSNDFALSYGFSNSMLTDISHIANGTINSNSSSQSLDKTSNSFKDTTNKIESIENNYTSGLSNSLNNISTDVDTSVSGGGQYFKNSIIWVNTQFDKMTNNTPFGTLLGFGLVLGISLLVIGKALR